MSGSASDSAKRYWLGLAGWTREEAAHLLLGFLSQDEEGHLFGQDCWPDLFEGAMDELRRAGKTGALSVRGGLFIPAEVTRWACERENRWSPFPFSLADLEAALTGQGSPNKPVYKMPLQEQAILRALADLGFNREALPKPVREGGAKARVRERLVGAGGTHPQLFPSEKGRHFDKAWERLRTSGQIKGGR